MPVVNCNATAILQQYNSSHVVVGLDLVCILYPALSSTIYDSYSLCLRVCLYFAPPYTIIPASKGTHYLTDLIQLLHCYRRLLGSAEFKSSLPTRYIDCPRATLAIVPVSLPRPRRVSELHVTNLRLPQTSSPPRH